MSEDITTTKRQTGMTFYLVHILAYIYIYIYLYFVKPMIIIMSGAHVMYMQSYNKTSSNDLAQIRFVDKMCSV